MRTTVLLAAAVFFLSTSACAAGKKADAPAAKPAANADPLWSVKDNGKRCIVAPCPSWTATNETTHEAVEIAGLDFSALGLDAKEEGYLRAKVQSGASQARGVIETRAKMGPGGDGKVLKISALSDSKRGESGMPSTNKKEQVFGAAATSIRFEMYSGGGSIDETLDLASGKISSKSGSRTVDAAELAAVKATFGALSLSKMTEPNDGPPPGGSWRFEIKEGSTTRILAGLGGVPKGTEYFPIDEEQGEAIDYAWPGVVRKAKPTVEHRVKEFVGEVIFGSPGGDFDMKGARRRLERGGGTFELIVLPDLADSSNKLSVQLRPTGSTKVDLKTLAAEMDIAKPTAIRVNTEHNVWQMGDGDKVVSVWRQLGVVEIKLTMPRGSHEAEPIDGATLESLITRAQKR